MTSADSDFSFSKNLKSDLNPESKFQHGNNQTTSGWGAILTSAPAPPWQECGRSALAYLQTLSTHHTDASQSRLHPVPRASQRPNLSLRSTCKGQTLPEIIGLFIEVLHCLWILSELEKGSGFKGENQGTWSASCGQDSKMSSSHTA